jgi:hypothetical protein
MVIVVPSAVMVLGAAAGGDAGVFPSATAAATK